MPQGRLRRGAGGAGRRTTQTGVATEVILRCPLVGGDDYVSAEEAAGSTVELAATLPD